VKTLQELGEAVAARRKQLGLKQGDVAVMAGVTAESLSRFERGRSAEFGTRKLLAVDPNNKDAWMFNAYAAQGLDSDGGGAAGGEIRDFLERMETALRAVPGTLAELIAAEGLEPQDLLEEFRRVIGADAGAAASAVALARSREPYYVPEGTSLNTQLLNFQRQRRRVAFVVDEYGDVQGLVTLEDLLEEIVGEFTSDTSSLHKAVHKEKSGTFIVNAAASVRTLNRKMGWSLPTSGPRTLNGLIIEYLETIPEAGTSLRVNDYSIDILQTGENAVKTVRLKPLAPASTPPAASERRG
jgi:transcriptional regulator with XRE-family HTH domain